MKAFLRENLMIVISIALPVLVAILFGLASVLPGLFSDPPGHDLLLSLNGRATAKASDFRINLVVRDGELKAAISKPAQPNYNDNPRLFRYSHLTGRITEISMPEPDDGREYSDGTEVSIPGLESVRVSDAIQAPDGYEFRGRRRHGGFMTELFGGSRNRTDVSIANNGAVVRLRLPTSDYWYNDVRFVGWIVEQR